MIAINCVKKFTEKVIDSISENVEFHLIILTWSSCEYDKSKKY